MNWQQVEPLLYKGQDVAIMVHERPDGDALGSALGLAIVLHALGMSPRVLRVQPIDETFAFLPGQSFVEVVPRGELELPKNGAVMVLDCGDAERCEYFLGNKRPLVNADHHTTNPGFGIINWVDPGASATAELLCRLFYEDGIMIPPDAATCFYLALLTDTGWFHYPNVTWKTMAAASHLIRQGADLQLIRTRFAESHPVKELRMLREVMNRFRFILDDQVILCSLPFEVMTKQGILTSETDHVFDVLKGTQGVEAAVLLKEVEPNLIKISMRTKQVLDASEMTRLLGGGGHVRAAGATFAGSLEAAETRIIEILGSRLSAATPAESGA